MNVLEVIKELESKGFRISIFPQMQNGSWFWTAGVYIGNDKTAIWVDSNNGLPRAAYTTYEEAFNKVVDYCNNYKPKKEGYGKKAKLR